MVCTFSLCLGSVFSFFSLGDLSSPYLESVQYFAYFCFSLDTVFSSVPGFPFEVNQINLRPDRDTVCVCVGQGEAVREMGRVCFTMTITGARVLFPACYHSLRGAAFAAPGLKFWLAVVCGTAQYVCPCVQVKNKKMCSFTHMFSMSTAAY